MTLITLENITKVYRSKQTASCQALKNITCTFEAGKSYSIMGPSGAGKSTLLGILAGTVDPTEGTYTFQGQHINQLPDRKKSRIRNQHIGLIVQDFALLEGETALKNCMYPALFAGMRYHQARERAMDMLDRMELLRYASKNISLLSGGERQRTAIARAMMNHPALILADEPTGALDSHTSAMVMDALLQMQREGATLILATHNPECAAMCDQHLYLKDGELTQGLLIC